MLLGLQLGLQRQRNVEGGVPVDVPVDRHVLEGAQAAVHGEAVGPLSSNDSGPVAAAVLAPAALVLLLRGRAAAATGAVGGGGGGGAAAAAAACGGLRVGLAVVAWRPSVVP